MIKKENELQIHQNRRDQEIRFLALHGYKILLCSTSIKEVLAAFQELPIFFCNGI